MLTIIAVVAASATLHSGGLDVLLRWAPSACCGATQYVSILAPFVTCLLTAVRHRPRGLHHAAHHHDIAIKNNIRPERPMAAASVASQMGILASPVSVAVVSLVAFLAKAPVDGHVIDFIALLSITIPATLVGVPTIISSAGSAAGPDQDETFRPHRRSEQRKIVYGETGPSATLLGKTLTASQWTAMWIFIGAIVVVAVLDPPALRPVMAGKPMSMVLIQMFMPMAGAFIVMFTKTDPHHRQDRGVPRRHGGGGGGFRHRLDGRHGVRRATCRPKAALTDLVKTQPWTYAIALLLVSAGQFAQPPPSARWCRWGWPYQRATGLHRGLRRGLLRLLHPADLPSDLAAIQFDRSGTTRIGKYVINHSFIIPGLIGEPRA